MKKYLLAVSIALSLVCTVPSFADAVEANLSNSEITTLINTLISIGVIPQNKIAAANAFLAQLNNSGGAASTFNISCHGTPSATGDNKVVWEALAPVGIESVIPYTYSWSGTDGLTGTTQSLSKIYSSFGTKNATVTISSGTETGTVNCSADVLPIDIISAPTKPLTGYVSCVANPSRAPIGSTINWTAVADWSQLTKYPAPYTYVWSDNEGSSGTTTGSTGKTVPKVYNSAGIKTATVKITTPVPGEADAEATISCNASIYDPNVSQGLITPLKVSCLSNTMTTFLGSSTNSVVPSGNIAFTARASGGDGGYTYLWSDTDGDEGYAGYALLKAYTTPGNKKMNVKVTSGTQTATASCNFNVINTPPPPLNISCYGTPSSGGKVTWNILGLNPTSELGRDSDGKENYSYLWYLPNKENSIFTEKKPVSKVYTTTGTTTANLKVYSGDQVGFATCYANVSSVAEASKWVSCVANPPRVPIGSPINWSAIVQGGIGALTYNWSDGEGTSVVGGQTVTQTYNTAGVKTTTMKVTDSTGQWASIECKAAVYNPSLPTGLLTPLTASCSSDVTTVAKGGGVLFTINTTGGDGGFKYLWSDTDGDEGYAGFKVWKTYPTPGNKTMTIKVTDGTQTVTTSCNFNVVDSSTIGTPLSTTCSASPSTIAPGQSITWTAHPVGGSGNYLYFWGDNEGLIGQAGQSVSKTYNSVGEKTASVIVGALDVISGSQAGMATCSANVESPVTPEPNTSLSVSCSATPSTVSTGQFFNVTATPSGGNTSYTGSYIYSWLDGQQNTIGGNSQTLYISSPTVGVKNFLVQVTLGEQTASSTCSVNVTYPNVL